MMVFAEYCQILPGPCGVCRLLVMQLLRLVPAASPCQSLANGWQH